MPPELLPAALSRRARKASFVTAPPERWRSPPTEASRSPEATASGETEETAPTGGGHRRASALFGLGARAYCASERGEGFARKPALFPACAHREQGHRQALRASFRLGARACRAFAALGGFRVGARAFALSASRADGASLLLRALMRDEGFRTRERGPGLRAGSGWVRAGGAGRLTCRVATRCRRTKARRAASLFVAARSFVLSPSQRQPKAKRNGEVEAKRRSERKRKPKRSREGKLDESASEAKKSGKPSPLAARPRAGEAKRQRRGRQGRRRRPAALQPAARPGATGASAAAVPGAIATGSSDALARRQRGLFPRSTACRCRSVSLRQLGARRCCHGRLRGMKTLRTCAGAP